MASFVIPEELRQTDERKTERKKRRSFEAKNVDTQNLVNLFRELLCLYILLQNMTSFTWENLRKIYSLPFRISGSIYLFASEGSYAFRFRLCSDSNVLRRPWIIIKHVRHLQFMNMFNVQCSFHTISYSYSYFVLSMNNVECRMR